MFSNFLKKVKNNLDFRTKSLLLLSLVFNFIYAIFLFIVSKIYFSKWFYVMSIYYGLLSIARVFMFFQTNPNKQTVKKILIMRLCGYFLFLLNVVVSVMMFIIIYTDQPIKHHEITVIALATYTFSALTLSIIGSVKHLRKNDYVYSCVKVISLISVSVSMVTLTNTMLTTFGEENLLLRSITLPLLSGAVSIFIIVCAIFMIIKANKDLRILKNEEK